MRSPTAPRGLSPRVRGNRHAFWATGMRGRSIPACAGEPDVVWRADHANEVYPRVCGGTSHPAPSSTEQEGLSPRVRGNHNRRLVQLHIDRSIPACAGEPRRVPRQRDETRVYPRVCGGTDTGVAELMGDRGLSPRVRGNLAGAHSGAAPFRSIPACAGEPVFGGPNRGWHKVYPRVCGGTQGRQRQPPTFGGGGLSPRVRGNPSSVTRKFSIAGSIPACAGEPAPAAAVWGIPGVYPRVCGGTVLHVGALRRVTRSIPACAGEPQGGSSANPSQWVYPRVCGGTGRPAPALVFGQGLSPRVRGNPISGGTLAARNGSIPACAGEPRGACAGRAYSGVYPRVCGGTLG